MAGKWIQKAIKHPGAEKRAAKKAHMEMAVEFHRKALLIRR